MNAHSDLHTAAREIHRTWILWHTMPALAWHTWRAERHRKLAQHHRDQAHLNSRKTIDLARKYPSLYWKTGA